MKQCPACNRTYTDDSQIFCLEDGSQLQAVGAGSEVTDSYDANATLAFGPGRDTNPPPVYASPVIQPPAAQQWTPAPQYSPASVSAKRGGRGWIVVGIAGVLVLGIGIVVLLAVIGRDNSAGQTNTSPGSTKIDNRGTSSSSPTLPSNVLKDDFSTQNWPIGEAGLGSFYQDGEYHMTGKSNQYLYMFPSAGGYLSENATVKVTVRSVHSRTPEYGFGLVVHGRRSSSQNLEGYGFLIYTGDVPKYEIVRFTEGKVEPEVDWTASTTIRGSTSPNQIEVRSQGSQLSLYVNGQFVRSITDTVGFTRGGVGLYTTDTAEVAFDDMEIVREQF